MIKTRNINYGLTIKNHPWLNEKCIEHFENRTGIELIDAAKKCIILGAFTADFDIIGSSSTKGYYNDVGWDVELYQTNLICSTNNPPPVEGLGKGFKK